jgi:glycosyltransferase involved in cell wall biosynthesis
VFVGKSRASVPPTEGDERKYAINQRYVDTVVVCTAERPGVTRPSGARVLGLPDPRVPGVGRACFYTLGPALAVGLAAGRRRAVVVAQSPFEGACVFAWRQLLPRRRRPRVQIELHGEWSTATRLYGSPLRRIWSRPADAVAERALRRADRVRAVSQVLEERARAAGYDGPIDRFVAYSEYGELLADPPAPMPAAPRVLFAGVMERYKGVDVLLEAWPLVVARVPAARLLMVGSGSLAGFVREEVDRRGLAGSVEIRQAVPKREMRVRLDAATCLVLPSRSEGLPRVVLEAMARGRPVVATRVGGLAELVDSGTNGCLVDPESADDLADALCVVLESRDLAAKLGRAARAVAEVRDPAAEYEAGIARLAQWIGAP